MDRSAVKGLLAALLLAGSTLAHAGTFNVFQPATGILKGNTDTPVTTAATSLDVRSLWLGTCDASTFLRGDGQCVAGGGGGGGGSVTSVSMTVPSVLAVSGSPITTSGTLAVTFAAGQAANRFLATPNGSTGPLGLRAVATGDLPLIPLTTGVTGVLPGANGGTNNAYMQFAGPNTATKTYTLPNASATILTNNAAVTVSQGGTGVTTLTGIPKASGTAAFTAALSADVLALWTGTCDATTFLRGDGACVAGGGGGGGAVSSVGLAAPTVFSVSSSPVTSSGTINLGFATGQPANQVLATPNGSTGPLGLRALVGADIPQVSLAAAGNGGVTGNLPVGNLNGGTNASNLTYWRGDGNWVTPPVADVASGTYTPTISAVSGVATNTGTAVTPPWVYSRVGTIVTVSGTAQFAVTSAGSALFSVTLPVASAAATLYGTGSCIGVRASGDPAGANASGVLTFNASPGRMILNYYAVGTHVTNALRDTMSCTYQYVVS